MCFFYYFHTVYIEETIVYLEKNSYLIGSSYFVLHFLREEEYWVIFSGKHLISIL